MLAHLFPDMFLKFFIGHGLEVIELPVIVLGSYYIIGGTNKGSRHQGYIYVLPEFPVLLSFIYNFRNQFLVSFLHFVYKLCSNTRVINHLFPHHDPRKALLFHDLIDIMIDQGIYFFQ